MADKVVMVRSHLRRTRKAAALGARIAQIDYKRKILQGKDAHLSERLRKLKETRTKVLSKLPQEEQEGDEGGHGDAG